jgi:hypothetical protein
MSVIEDIETEISEIFSRMKSSPAVQAVETDIKSIATATVSYIKSNGLEDIYQLALEALPALTGQPWLTVLAKIEADAITAGKTLAKGASAIVASQAQADLLAAGTLTAPVTSPASSAPASS